MYMPDGQCSLYQSVTTPIQYGQNHKTYYVVGGLGFLGSHLVEKLVSIEGARVIVGLRRYDSILNILHCPVELDYGYKMVEQADMVYYCAGVLGKHGIPLSDYQEAHVNFPKLLIRRLNNRQIFIYVSSAYVFNPTEEYEKTKVVGEKIVRESGLPYNIARPAPIFGERDLHHLPLFKMINRLGCLTPIIGSANNRVCICSVKDAIFYIMNPPRREYTIAEIPIRMIDLIKMIARALNKPAPFIHIPYRKGLFRNISGVKFLTEERIYSGFHGSVPIQSCISDAVRWYKANGYL